MNGQQVPATALRIIRMALLSGVILFGAVIAFLSKSGGITVDPELGGILRIAFLVVALPALAGMIVIRSAVARAAPERRGQLAIIGWALAEASALFGGVCWLIAGQRILYFTGVALLVAAILLIPVSADE